jgi:hypothetical protein
MTQYPDDLSAEDRCIYRRWVRGLFVFYFVAIVTALGISFVNRPADDLRASNETQIARIKAKTESIAISQPAGVVRNQ